MQSISNFFARIWQRVASFLQAVWRSFRARKPWQQWLIGAVIVLLLVAGIAFAHKGTTDTTASQDRTVTVASVGSLSGDGSGTSLVGTVRSVTEAELFAQAGGTVKSVHTSLGAHVPAGFVIADLDNASEAAAVLQAQGAYDAAVANRNITGVQSGNSQTSFAEAQNQARTTYRSAYTAVDGTLHDDIDTFFGGPTSTGPQLLINEGQSNDLSQQRDALEKRIDAWQQKLATADSQDPSVLLSQATADTQAVSDFLVQLAAASTDRGARSSESQKASEATQITALARARATVDAQLSALSGARDAYNAKKTSAQVAGSGSSQSGTEVAAANAGVESALGGLRAAQAAYEKTRIRATIGGTVNFLPVKTGQYVSAFEHVATVANNGALEIVAYISEDQREAVAVGMKVTVEGNHDGIVTEVAPALDPTTKQIEVHVAVDTTPDLVNGQTVRITLPSDAANSAATPAVTASSTGSMRSSVLIPLAAVKLLPDSRAVFTVEGGKLVAHTVTIGDVVGDRIEVLSGLTSDMTIVTDARGLSEGQKVMVATSTTP